MDSLRTPPDRCLAHYGVPRKKEIGTVNCWRWRIYVGSFYEWQVLGDLRLRKARLSSCPQFGAPEARPARLIRQSGQAKNTGSISGPKLALDKLLTCSSERSLENSLAHLLGIFEEFSNRFRRRADQGFPGDALHRRCTT
jgi:hypothetical protein